MAHLLILMIVFLHLTAQCRTAYNIYYQAARRRMLASLPSNGKVGFENLAQTISESWKNLDDETRAEFYELARIDMDRYLRQKEDWQAAVAELAQVHSTKSLEQKGSKTGGTTVAAMSSLLRANPSTSSLQKPKSVFKKARKMSHKRVSPTVLKKVLAQQPPKSKEDTLVFQDALDQGFLEPYSIEEMRSLPSLSSRLDPSVRRFLANHLA